MDPSDPNSWRWIWLVAAAVFGIGEMAMAGSFFLAPFALGAVVAAILAFAGVSIVVQWIVFVVVSLVSFLALRPLARRLDERTNTTGVGANRLIGERARVVDAIGPGHAPGMVRIGGEQWRAESADATEIANDTSVVITEVRGTRVVVRPADVDAGEATDQATPQPQRKVP